MATEPEYVVRDKRALVNKVDGEKNVSRYIIFFCIKDLCSQEASLSKNLL